MSFTIPQNSGSSIVSLIPCPRVFSATLTLLLALPRNSGYDTASLRPASFWMRLCNILLTLPQRVTTGNERPMSPCSSSQENCCSSQYILQHNSHCLHRLSALPGTACDDMYLGIYSMSFSPSHAFLPYPRGRAPRSCFLKYFTTSFALSIQSLICRCTYSYLCHASPAIAMFRSTERFVAIQRIGFVPLTSGKLHISFKYNDHTWAWHPKHNSCGGSTLSSSQAAFITLHVSVTKAAVLCSKLCFRRTSKVLSATYRAAKECKALMQMFGGVVDAVYRAEDGLSSCDDNKNFCWHSNEGSPVTCSVVATVISIN